MRIHLALSASQCKNSEDDIDEWAMNERERIVAVIPALDEEGNIADVVRGLLPTVHHVVVADNGSRDTTRERARQAGAEVVDVTDRGYGAACLGGIRKAKELSATIVLFLDGDGSDDPSEADRLLQPVLAHECDLALGVRKREAIEPGAMTPVQRFGNWFAPHLMRLVVGAKYTDMPPYKAIRMSSLEALALSDRHHGFTIELLLRAYDENLRICEVPVSCRARRSGISKVSGNVYGSLRAAGKITWSIARYAFKQHAKKKCTSSETDPVIERTP